MRHAALLAALVLVVSVAATASPAVAGAATPPGRAPTALDGPPTVAVGQQPSAGQTGDSRPLLGSSERRSLTVGTPRTNFTVALREDGSARWTVATRIPLADDADREAFREYAQAYEAGEAAGGPDVVTFRNAAAAASEATGREMSIRAVNRTATLASGSGVLRLRFTWERFLAEADDGELVLGDAFETPGNGTWFGSLATSQRLVVEPPEGYEVSDVSQGFSYSISDRRIVAEGPQRFAAGDIEVTYAPGAPTRQGIPPSLLGVAAGVLLLAVAAFLVYRLRSRGPDLGGAGAAEPAGDGAAANGSTAAADADGGSVVDGAAPADAAGDTGAADPANAGDGDANGASGGVEPDEEDLELLSDEERVERLLDEHGGRMRQANIVGETGWSDAKVSQLLSAMAEAGRVEKLRLGRENLISLADGEDAEEGRDAADDGVGGDGSGDVRR